MVNITLPTAVRKLKNIIKELYHSYGKSHMITQPWSLDRCRLKAYQRHESKNYMFIKYSGLQAQNLLTVLGSKVDMIGDLYDHLY